MTLVKWNPNRSLFDWSNDFLGDFFNREHFLTRDRDTWYPNVDVEENENQYRLNIELPGMNKEDVKITFQDDVLSISGEKKSEKREENTNYHCYERRFGKFERAFRIHSDVIEEKIEANFKDGILNVVLPKAEVSKPKQIEVKVK